MARPARQMSLELFAHVSVTHPRRTARVRDPVLRLSYRTRVGHRRAVELCALIGLAPLRTPASKLPLPGTSTFLLPTSTTASETPMAPRHPQRLLSAHRRQRREAPSREPLHQSLKAGNRRSTRVPQSFRNNSGTAVEQAAGA
jgi:hypothetical protein